MNQVRLACELPFCQNPKGIQTNFSICIIITAVVLGALAVLVGALILFNIPSLSHLGTTVGWTLISVGIVLLLIGISIKCVKDKSQITDGDASQFIRINETQKRENEKKAAQQDIVERNVGNSNSNGADIHIDKPLVVQYPAPQIDKTLLFKNYPKPGLGPITSGYGEYLIYRNDEKEARVTVSEEIYKEAFTIFEDHRKVIFGKELLPEPRFQTLRGKVKRIDSTLEIAFVPMTLYSLAFLRKCIKEDLKQGVLCNAVQLRDGPDSELARKCFWQTCHFIPKRIGMNAHTDNQELAQSNRVREIAFRLNASILKCFKGRATQEGCFFFEDIKKVNDELIHFFIQVHETSNSEITKKIFNNDNKPSIGNCYFGGATSQMAIEITRGSLMPYGIYNERHISIINNALELECSPLVKENHVILYRGSNFSSDLLVKRGSINSLSFGTGLFHGCLYDGGASAFHYMRQKDKDAQAIIVPLDEIATSPFVIPLEHPIRQICSSGEYFHARTKVWTVGKKVKIKGFYNGGKLLYKTVDESVKTNQSGEYLQEVYFKYKSQTILLV